MRHLAAVEAKPSAELKQEGSVPTRLTDHVPLRQGHRYCEVRDLRGIHLRLLEQTIFRCTAALNSVRDGPMGHGFYCNVMQAALTSISGIIVVRVLFGSRLPRGRRLAMAQK